MVRREAVAALADRQEHRPSDRRADRRHRPADGEARGVKEGGPQPRCPGLPRGAGRTDVAGPREAASAAEGQTHGGSGPRSSTNHVGGGRRNRPPDGSSTSSPNDPMRVSHETIQTSLYVQAKRGLPNQLMVHPRTKRVLDALRPPRCGATSS